MAYVCDSLNEFGQGLNCIEHTELIVKFQMLPEISIAQGNAIGSGFSNSLCGCPTLLRQPKRQFSRNFLGIKPWKNVQKFKPTLAQKASVVAATGYMALARIYCTREAGFTIRHKYSCYNNYGWCCWLYRLSDLLF